MPDFTITQIAPLSLQVTHNGCTLRIDAPTEYLGPGQTPSPTDLLAIALGACKALTALIWANRRKTPVTNLVTQVHSEFATNPTRVSQLSVTLKNLKSQIPEPLHPRLEQAIENCYVAQTLKHPPTINTQIE